MPIKLLDSRPFPEISVAVLREVSVAARTTGAEWFIGGATARDAPARITFVVSSGRRPGLRPGAKRRGNPSRAARVMIAGTERSSALAIAAGG